MIESPDLLLAKVDESAAPDSLASETTNEVSQLLKDHREALLGEALTAGKLKSLELDGVPSSEMTFKTPPAKDFLLQAFYRFLTMTSQSSTCSRSSSDGR